MGPQTNSNNFFGIAVSLPGINVNQASPNQMMYTNDYSTTTWRDKNGNITLQEGNLGNNDYGLSAGGGSVILDSKGLSISSTSGSSSVKITNTASTYSLNSIPQLIVGILPDGTVGIVQSISGVNVNDIFS